MVGIPWAIFTSTNKSILLGIRLKTHCLMLHIPSFMHRSFLYPAAMAPFVCSTPHSSPTSQLRHTQNIPAKLSPAPGTSPPKPPSPLPPGTARSRSGIPNENAAHSPFQPTAVHTLPNGAPTPTASSQLYPATLTSASGICVHQPAQATTCK